MEVKEQGPYQRKAFRIKLAKVEDDGSFTGYGSVFGVLDSYNEVVERGAFTSSLKKHKDEGTSPKMLWQHDAAQPIGIWTYMQEDERGLAVAGQLAIDENPAHEVRQAREAHKLMKMRALDGLSIGYRVIVRETDEDANVTRLKELDLWEVSPVTFPANTQARISQVKSVRDVERVLRDAGLSRKDAATVATYGFGALTNDPREAEAKRDEALLELAKQFREISTNFSRKE